VFSMDFSNCITSIVQDDKCTSCFACYNACPNNALIMILSPHGFYRPKLIENRCNNCGICKNMCPILENSLSDRRNRTPENVLTYAAWSKNETLRKSSSSGGIFSEIANIIIDNCNGIVYGAKWDSNWIVRHGKAETKQGILPFRSSKYLQSNIGFAYKEISKNIKKGKTVLFSGLPCQAAALRKFVDSENLITIDLVCHGTPSIIIFHKYLEYISKSRMIKSINFRDKKKGWSNFRIVVDFADGSSYSNTFRQDPFLVGFLNNLYSNYSCYNCPFCSMPRQGDITLADYWGVPKQYRNNQGVSLVLSNNKIGDNIISALKEKGNIVLVETSFNSALKGNPRIIQGSRQIPKERYDFLHQIQHTDFEGLLHIIDNINYYKFK
jgi:coenzyme F420-reducing hydrogenase beta subunit